METKNDYFTNILETCDGNLDFLIELSTDLLNMFSSETHEMLGKYIQEENGENIAKTAHKLRGAVVNFNMEKTASLLQELELMGKRNDLKGSTEKTEYFVANAQRIREN